MEISIRILTWAPRPAPFDTFNVPSLHCLLFSYRNPYSKAINYSRLTPQKIFRTERGNLFIHILLLGIASEGWAEGFEVVEGLRHTRTGWFGNNRPLTEGVGWSGGLKVLDMQLSVRFSLACQQHLDIIYCSHRNQYSSGRRTMSYDTEILNFRLWATFVSWMRTHSTSFITLLKLFPLRTFIYILNIALIVSRIDVFYFTSSSVLFLHCAEIFFYEKRMNYWISLKLIFRGNFAALRS